MSGSSEHSPSGQLDEIERRLADGLPLIEDSVASDGTKKPAEQSSAAVAAATQTPPAAETVAERLAKLTGEISEEEAAQLTPSLRKRIEGFAEMIGAQNIKQEQMQATQEGIQKMIDQITAGKTDALAEDAAPAPVADDVNAPVTDKDAQAIKVKAAGIFAEFEPHHFQAIAHFIDRFKDIYEFRQHDLNDAHAGGTFWTLPKDGTEPVKAFSLTPGLATIHAPDNDDVLKHTLILFAQAYGTDLKITASPEKLEQMKKIMAELHAAGELVDHEGKALPGSTPLIINGEKLNSAKATGAERSKILNSLKAAFSRSKTDTSSPAEDSLSGPVPSATRLSEVPQEPGIQPVSAAPTSEGHKLGTTPRAPAMEDDIAPQQPVATKAPAAEALALS